MSKLKTKAFVSVHALHSLFPETEEQIYKTKSLQVKYCNLMYSPEQNDPIISHRLVNLGLIVYNK